MEWKHVSQCEHAEREAGCGTYTIHQVTTRLAAVRKSGYALAITYTGTTFPDTLLLNRQTGEVNVSASRAYIEQHKSELPDPVIFCTRCGKAAIPHWKTSAGEWIPKYRLRDNLGKYIHPPEQLPAEMPGPNHTIDVPE
jgi:hypothetical protein